MNIRPASWPVQGLRPTDIGSPSRIARRLCSTTNVVRAALATAALALAWIPAAAAPVQGGDAHAVRFQAPYARLNDAPDLYAAVLAAKANGSADEKGWAGSALSTCMTWRRLTLNFDPKLPVAEQRERQAAMDEILRRCSGIAQLTRPESEALRDELFEAMRHSDSELGRLNAMGAAPDGLSFRPLTEQEMRALSAALHDDDPIVRRAVVGVISGALDSGPGSRAHSTAFLEALEPPELTATFSQLDSLRACAFDGVCGHPRSAAALASSWRTPQDEQQVRLRRRYADADAQRLSVQQILEIR